MYYNPMKAFRNIERNDTVEERIFYKNEIVSTPDP